MFVLNKAKLIRVVAVFAQVNDVAHGPLVYFLLVADALKQQKDWIFSKLSPSLTQWYKQVIN